jgi:hypothetical protein
MQYVFVDSASGGLTVGIFSGCPRRFISRMTSSSSWGSPIRPSAGSQGSGVGRTPDSAAPVPQLAALSYDRLLGTPAGIMTLRVLKAERVGDTLGDVVWEEEVWRQLDSTFVAALCRYLLSTGTVDPASFRSKVLQLSDVRIRDQAMTTAEQLRLEGRREGRLEALHDYVLEALEVRFGDVPASVRVAVSEITDEARLRELLRAGIRTPTLAAFLDGLEG